LTAEGKKAVASSAGCPPEFIALPVVITLFATPAAAGPPFRTDDPEPVDFGHFEIYLFSLGTRNRNGSDGILPGLEVNYGAAPNLQISAVIPQEYGAEREAPTRFGRGDLEFSAKYRFIVPDEGSWLPEAAVDPAVVAPVGNQKLGFSSGHAQIFLPLWLQKDFGPWTAYGGGGYWINPGVGNRNYGFVGAALWRKTTDRLHLGIEIFHQSSPALAVKASTGLDVGVIYDLSETWHVLAAVGSGLQNRTDTHLVSYNVAVELTF
jgi:hypothetical protein